MPVYVVPQSIAARRKVSSPRFLAALITQHAPSLSTWPRFLAQPLVGEGVQITLDLPPDTVALIDATAARTRLVRPRKDRPEPMTPSRVVSVMLAQHLRPAVPSAKAVSLLLHPRVMRWLREYAPSAGHTLGSFAREAALWPTGDALEAPITGAAPAVKRGRAFAADPDAVGLTQSTVRVSAHAYDLLAQRADQGIPARAVLRVAVMLHIAHHHRVQVLNQQA